MWRLNGDDGAQWNNVGTYMKKNKEENNTRN